MSRFTKILTGTLALTGAVAGLFALSLALTEKKMLNSIDLKIACLFLFFISSCVGGTYYVLITRFWKTGLYGTGIARVVAGTFGIFGAFVMLLISSAALYKSISLGKTLQDDGLSFLFISMLLLICVSGIIYAFLTQFWKRFA